MSSSVCMRARERGLPQNNYVNHTHMGAEIVNCLECGKQLSIIRKFILLLIKFWEKLMLGRVRRSPNVAILV